MRTKAVSEHYNSRNLLRKWNIYRCQNSPEDETFDLDLTLYCRCSQHFTDLNFEASLNLSFPWELIEKLPKPYEKVYKLTEQVPARKDNLQHSQWARSTDDRAKRLFGTRSTGSFPKRLRYPGRCHVDVVTRPQPMEAKENMFLNIRCCTMQFSPIGEDGVLGIMNKVPFKLKESQSLHHITLFTVLIEAQHYTI